MNFALVKLVNDSKLNKLSIAIDSWSLMLWPKSTSVLIDFTLVKITGNLVLKVPDQSESEKRGK